MTFEVMAQIQFNANLIVKSAFFALIKQAIGLRLLPIFPHGFLFEI
jgi:hypothetical protein